MFEKYFEEYPDQHVRSIVAYGKAADHKLYADAKYTVKFLKADMVGAFQKGMLLVHDGTNLLRPVKLSGAKVTTMDGTTAVTGTEWTADEAEG